jgi:hypothetical protein
MPPKPGGILDENPTDNLHRASGHEVFPWEVLAHKMAHLAPGDLLLSSGIQDLYGEALVAQAADLLSLPARVDPDEVRGPLGHVATDEAGILDGERHDSEVARAQALGEQGVMDHLQALEVRERVGRRLVSVRASILFTNSDWIGGGDPYDQPLTPLPGAEHVLQMPVVERLEAPVHAPPVRLFSLDV